MKTCSKTKLRTLFILVSVSTLVTTFVVAKRLPPEPVTPVVHEGIKYSANGDGRDQYLVATDMKSGNKLWRVRVFHNQIKPGLEEDVQWVFITDLKLVGSSVFVKDERERCYSVDLKTRRVMKQTCGDFPDMRDAHPQE